MRVALVCIAKDEDHYIDEWIAYHKKIGFDDIHIYQNDWRWSGETDNVYKHILDGANKQINAYNDFIQNNRNNYDWAAFFDIDEFLVLKKHDTVKNFISDYKTYNAIGINWVLFGDNGHKTVINDYSVLKRFTKREISANIHVKCIVKLGQNIFMDVHSPNVVWVDTNKNVNFGNFNNNPIDDVAQINHYFCKTKEEFILKCERGRADTIMKRTIDEFDGHNFNQINDYTAYNFLYK